MNPRPVLLVTVICASAVFILPGHGQETGPSVIFTSAQAEAGRAAYENSCGKCHTLTLLGRKGDPGELPPVSSLPESYQKFVSNRGYISVPPLAGKVFMDRWGSKTAAQLIDRFQITAMDRSFQFEGMTDDAVVNITAYVLQVNDAKPGTRPLSRSTTEIVSSVTR